MITPNKVSSQSCFSRLNEFHAIDSLWESGATNIQIEDFRENACYELAYKNFNYDEPLDIWVFDGDKEKKDVGIKMFKSFPYKELKFKVGDYIEFDYYKDGTLTTWLLMSFDSQNNYDWVGTIRQCNNELKRVNKYGEVKTFPVTFDKEAKYTTNFPSPALTTIAGFETCWLQFNSDSNEIKKNDRFLLGNPDNWIALKVQANGVNNFIRRDYKNPFSTGLIQLKLDAGFIHKDIDDLINGIADAYINEYTLVIDQGNVEQLIGFTTQLTSTLKHNGEVVYSKIHWESSDNSICTVDETGILSCLSEGNAVITAYFDDNKTVSDSIAVSVVQTLNEEYEIRIVPFDYSYTNAILQEQSVVYDVRLYKNDVEQSDEFIFNVSSESTATNYIFQVLDGNSFKVTNKKMSNYPVIVTCTSGENIKQYEIELRGAW